MNAHHRACNDCKLGIKAYQNLVGSLQAFERLVALAHSRDHVLISSVFCFAVVKYAKPFVDTETSSGRTRYPVRHLKAVEGFSAEMHAHLVELRNTLVAHDDLESIEPRLLQFCLSPTGSSFSIPIFIAVSNKCLSYPADLQSAQIMKDHVAACVRGSLDKLHADLARVREIALNHPEQRKENIRYQKDYGQSKVEQGGSHLQPPEFMSDEWLNASAPDFAHIHNGFRYEELRVRRDFNGPETIKLPDGCEIHIAPPTGKTMG
ncbi:MAG: hypothetical protein V4673_19285 [Pseudomonadota bacterium]